LWALTLSPAFPAEQSPPAEPLKTSITVVGEISSETPASVAALPADEVRAKPGVNLDDRLRDVPGFSLFRRSSSLTAHPTTQGVSLRGIGSTGASRTLVLWDGIPANDPFGGWVYWTRINPQDLERVEVSRGASTSVFGDRAMGGAIGLFSREPERYRAEGGYEGGGHNSHLASGSLSHLASRWAAAARFRAFSTDGFFLLPEDRRGSVDRRAGVDFAAGNASVDFLGAAHRFFLKLDVLAERRSNGTGLQRNSTGLGMLSGHYSWSRASDAWAVLGWHTREEFRSSFSAIAADRNSERPTFRQTVPAEATGAAGRWGRRGSNWNTLIGADATRVEGYSKDTLFPSGFRLGGGSLLQHGTFAQFDAAAGPARFFLGARHDFTGQDRQFFSPSAGVAAGRGRLRARGSVYRSFRSPTLNELFREFRVGNVVTRANDQLRPETLFGAEAGLDFVGESARAGVTFFRSSLDDLVTNVTVSTAPNLIVRQRRNAAAALARGVEVSASGRLGRWRGEAAYLFADSHFASGERLPQVPKHQGSAQVTYARGRTLAAAGVRSFGLQFEDDRNTQLLPGYASVQVYLRQELGAGVSAVASFENLLDRTYLAGFTPSPIVGPPRLWRVGLRWEGRLR
jgi:outer membrane receptor protein involved in Fe transport